MLLVVVVLVVIGLLVVLLTDSDVVHNEFQLLFVCLWSCVGSCVCLFGVCWFSCPEYRVE